MKKYYLFIALAMVAVMSVSCKNNKNAENNEATAEVVEAAKTILADRVLEKKTWTRPPLPKNRWGAPI